MEQNNQDLCANQCSRADDSLRKSHVGCMRHLIRFEMLQSSNFEIFELVQVDDMSAAWTPVSELM